ncbi:glycosyltransferase [Paenibacillus harenae]|uniref:GT2 family glycosyltransferase n=1 Tax=Paenibacillus harenae TaxID=306543 RepID=A0ABT9U4A5_PAEHA|nr:glycosyltransferase [Paenibacillus harenae]MDQ0114393.1 GT2 family glycosyltransferase [Paenibacillus harenae]
MADVGIVMPVYKQKTNFLLAAIRSVLKQKYRSFRLIIVIDGTTANVVRTVRRETRRDPRVKVVSYRVNRGTSHALNTGFGILNNDPSIQYLTWVSSDNIYLPNYVGTLRQGLLGAPEQVGFVYSSCYHINNLGKILHSPSRQQLLREWRGQPIKNIIESCFIGASFMYRKSAAIAVGEYRHTPVEDYDYWLRLTEQVGTVFLPVELMKYRVHSTFSMSRKLASSTLLYRSKRYISQLIRLEARQRRQIPLETTIIFTHSNTPNQLERLNRLLEQNYFNFLCIVIDQSPNQELHQPVKKLPDPRVHYISMPGASDQDVFLKARELTQSPYVLFYTGAAPLPKDFMRRAVGQLQSGYDDPTKPLFNQLHQAEKWFQQMVNQLYPEAV